MADATEQRTFPIQFERGATAHPTRIPWSVAELAYSVYAGRYGRYQSLDDLARRGGFGPSEMDEFLPGWRDRCDELSRLRRVEVAAHLLFDARVAQRAAMESRQPDAIDATRDESLTAIGRLAETVGRKDAFVSSQH